MRAGTLAAVALSAKASVALIDLSQKNVVAVIGTGYYPSHLAFSGSNLLVTNEASGTVSVIDTGTRALLQTVTVGLGPRGIAATPSVGDRGEHAGWHNLIHQPDGLFSFDTLRFRPEPDRTRLAVSGSANKALISTPMSDGFLILDLGTKTLTPVDTSVWNAMGPGAIVTNGNTAFIANMMTASVTAVDLTAARSSRPFPSIPVHVLLRSMPPRTSCWFSRKAQERSM